ncbi:uncharacterized protein LOC144449578 [Glandiceps talaboti]
MKKLIILLLISVIVASFIDDTGAFWRRRRRRNPPPPPPPPPPSCGSCSGMVRKTSSLLNSKTFGGECSSCGYDCKECNTFTYYTWQLYTCEVACPDNPEPYPSVPVNNPGIPGLPCIPGFSCPNSPDD